MRYFEQLGSVMAGVQVSRDEGGRRSLEEGIDYGVRLVEGCQRAGKKIIFIGNGGSAAIASHQAVDYWKNGHVRAMAFNDASLLTCVSNDFSYAEVFEKPMEMFAEAGDLVIAISSSGRSENILRGGRMALVRGCRLITMSGFKPDNPLRGLGEMNFYVDSTSYGHVEITHLALCHAMVDRLIERRVSTLP
jgi:D-sedoheptulose 7-phosphate isomerase